MKANTNDRESINNEKNDIEKDMGHENEEEKEKQFPVPTHKP